MPANLESKYKGKDAFISEVYFAVTPLKAGNLKISPAYLKGAIPSDQDLFDHYSDLDRVFNFSSFRKFMNLISSDVININSQKAKANQQLPLKIFH